MSRYPQYVLADMKAKIWLDFEDFINFLKILRPKSDDDKRIIDTTIDMFEQIYDDIKNATTLADIKPCFNVSELVEDWDDISNNLSINFSGDVMKMMSFIVDNCVDYPKE